MSLSRTGSEVSDGSGDEFETELVQDWAAGELRGIRCFGIEVRDPWTQKLALVVSEGGLALAARNGLSDVDRLTEALREAAWAEGS